MKLDVQIKNFGKVQDANIKLRPFTVIAGPNSSGKSFITKALYGFFNTINEDYLYTTLLESIDFLLFNSHLTVNASMPPNAFLPLLDKLKKRILYADALGHPVEEILNQDTDIIFIDDLLSSYEDLVDCIDQNTPEALLSAEYFESLIKILKDPKRQLDQNIAANFSASLQDNFQVQQLAELKSYRSTITDDASFNFTQLGQISFNANSELTVNLTNTAEFQNLYNVVFLESPIYWKIKNALEFTRKERSKQQLKNNRQYEALTGIPQHFYDLVDLLDTRVKVDHTNANDASLFEAINREIGGELGISQSGDIYFKEQGCPQGIGINSTASGITNIGLIALLLKRNVIANGSMLFVDEPEVNLHPAWQKVMIETLYKLSQNGINVVIASHSIDMMKSVENIMSELNANELENHFAINQLSRDGKSVNENMPAMKKIAAIKADLGKPFYDMLLESQW